MGDNHETDIEETAGTPTVDDNVSGAGQDDTLVGSEVAPGTKRGRGRPRNGSKTRYVKFRALEEDVQYLEAQAAAAGLYFSDIARNGLHHYCAALRAYDQARPQVDQARRQQQEAMTAGMVESMMNAQLRRER